MISLQILVVYIGWIFLVTCILGLLGICYICYLLHTGYYDENNPQSK